jgi:AcrR family transcriptional regulator
MTLNETAGMRQRILQEATHLFTRSGYNAVSMREIAAACGDITKAALYYHFKDKEALMVAILSEYLAGMGSLIAGCRDGAPGARARLTAFIRAIFAQPADQRAIIRLGSQELSNLSPQARASFGHLYQEEFIDPLAALIAEGMRSGELRLADSHQATWLLLGMMYPFFYPNQERSLDMESVINLMIAVFFDGMAARD